MIIYQNITLRQLIDEVALRATMFINPMNFDWDTLVIMANKSIKEVLVKTLPYKDWAYVETLYVSNGTILPRRFLKAIRVLISETGGSPFNEARYVDVKEWYSVTNWQRKSAWNMASLERPIYTLWGYLVTPATPSLNTARVSIHLAPNSGGQTGTAPPGIEYYTGADMSGIMECYTVPADLVGDADVIPIPAEFEELVVLNTLLRWVSKVADTQTLLGIQRQIAIERQKITERYMEKQRTEDRELASFTDPVPPFFDRKPTTGELPANLIGGQQ